MQYPAHTLWEQRNASAGGCLALNWLNYIKENFRRVKEENNLWDLESYKVIKNLKDRLAEVVV